MEGFSYLTVEGRSTGQYKDKGSRFIAFVFPVHSEEEAKHQLGMLRKEYHDARHHCFAWAIGPTKPQYRAADDGEPNHSAGDPILGQLRANHLTNTMAVVVRYFGGIKLGVGGLITAYKTATQNALEKAVIVEKEITEVVTLQFDYAYTPEAMRLVKEFELTVLSQDFESSCVLRAKIKLKWKEGFVVKTRLLNAMGILVRVEWPGQA